MLQRMRFVFLGFCLHTQFLIYNFFRFPEQAATTTVGDLCALITKRLGGTTVMRLAVELAGTDGALVII